MYLDKTSQSWQLTVSMCFSATSPCICHLSLPFIFLTDIPNISARCFQNSNTELLSHWHSAPLRHITPTMNVKQIWHAALIVNNLALVLRSAKRAASTFSSYQGLLFLQLLAGAQNGLCTARYKTGVTVAVWNTSMPDEIIPRSLT